MEEGEEKGWKKRSSRTGRKAGCPGFLTSACLHQPRTVLSEAARPFINARPDAKKRRPKSAAAKRRRFWVDKT